MVLALASLGSFAVAAEKDKKDKNDKEVKKLLGKWLMVHAEFDGLIIDGNGQRVEFKIVGDTEVGEMWIDDVSLEPVGCDGPEGP